MRTFFSGLAVYSGGGALSPSNAHSHSYIQPQCNVLPESIAFVQFIHPGAYQRACSCISSRRELQRGRSCNSPDSQYATTDIFSDTPAVRCRRNEGACTRHHAHKYLWQCIHCQVCTKRPYLLPADGTAFRSEPWIIWPVSRGCITVTRTVNEKQ